MKFQQVLESAILDPVIKAAKDLRSLYSVIKNDENKSKKATDIIQSYLSGIGAGSGKSVHQHGNDVQALLSALHLYIEGDDNMKKAAINGYNDKMSQIIKRRYK